MQNLVYHSQNQGFVLIYQGFRISALKAYPFYSKTWFSGEKPGLTEKQVLRSRNQVLQLQNMVLLR